MSKHTPEPWQTGREDMQSFNGMTGQPFSSIYRQAEDGRMPMTPDGFGGLSRVPLCIARVEGDNISRDEEKANARRIVACVNACAGMEDPAVEIAELRKAVKVLAEYVAGIEGSATFSQVCEMQRAVEANPIAAAAVKAARS